MKKLFSSSQPLPAHLQAAIAQLDNGPGVYVFYNENNYPLYIGKSKQVKTRVLSHVREFGRHRRKTDLIRQTQTIIQYPTAGEFTALFKEAEMIKQFLPLYNKLLRKRKNYASITLNDQGQIAFSKGINVEELHTHYGVFSHLKEAKETLIALAEKTPICKKLCGLSQTAPCFNYQLKNCDYACQQENYAHIHADILKTTLAELSLKQWPYPQQAIAVKESNLQYPREQYIVIYLWCYLGTVDTRNDALILLKKKSLRQFDKNYYRLALALLNKTPPQALFYFSISI